MISPESLAERIAVGGPDPEVARNIIAAATEWLGGQVGRYFGTPVAREQHLEGTGTTTIWLADPPIPNESDAGVEVTEAGYPGAEEEDFSDFVVRGRKLVRSDGGTWFLGAEYRASYSAGYEEDDGPADAREVVLQLSLLLWQESQSDRVGLGGETLGDYSWYRAAIGGLSQQLPIVASFIDVTRKLAI